MLYRSDRAPATPEMLKPYRLLRRWGFGVSGGIAARKSWVSTTLYRSNTARVRCPLIGMTTDSGTPTLRARVMKLRRRSWN
jgi:hypothetical protein